MTINRYPRKSKGRAARTLLSLATATLLLTIGGASAEWHVRDQQTRQNTQQISDRIGSDGTVNGNLVKLYNQQKFPSTSGNSELEAEPTADEKLDRTNPTAVTFGIDSRCPDAGAEGVPQQQVTLCQEIVKTELAKYRFSLRMYDRAKTRHERLKVIENERNNLTGDDQGKLQENSNKLLQLISLMEIDRQQSDTYMAAYDARLNHLTAIRDQMSKQVLGGKKCKAGLGALACSAISGGAGLGALNLALDALKTDQEYTAGKKG